MSKATKPKGFTPSPFFTSWWGSLAERVWRVAPLKRKASSRSEIPHKEQTDKTPHEKCPCEAFTMCDQYYQDMGPILKDAWRFCVKKKGMSGYGLFMKECLCLLIAGYNFPIGCSPSGGYNCITVEPGDEVPPLPEFIGQANVRWKCTGPPDWECVPSPSGAYDTLEGCLAICNLPVENTCMACDPAIPDTLYVTFTGLGGDFTIYNGQTPVYWSAGCTWIGGPGEFPTPPYIKVYWHLIFWHIEIIAKAGACGRIIRAEPLNPCDPTVDTYTELEVCADANCDNHSSCELSVGAVAQISYAPA